MRAHRQHSKGSAPKGGRWLVRFGAGVLVLMLLLWAFNAYLQPDMMLNFSTILQFCGFK